jgi:hypothetical protein
MNSWVLSCLQSPYLWLFSLAMLRKACGVATLISRRARACVRACVRVYVCVYVTAASMCATVCVGYRTNCVAYTVQNFLLFILLVLLLVLLIVLLTLHLLPLLLYFILILLPASPSFLLSFFSSSERSRTVHSGPKYRRTVCPQ